jgi:hypothetical protein
MSLLSALSPSQTMIGNDAGWALGFYTEDSSGTLGTTAVARFSREGYYAEIDATLPGNLGAGVYRFTIEGLSDADHGKLEPTGAAKPTVVKLYLYWRDTNASVAGYLANLGGLTDLASGGGLVGAASSALASAGGADPLASALVAVLAIRRVTRQVGTRRYETVIEATERVHARLGRRLAGALTGTDRADAANQIATLGGIPIEVDPPAASSATSAAGGGPATGGASSSGGGAGGSSASGGATPSPAFTRPQGTSYRDALSAIASDYEQASGKYGLGQLLIRDGKLYVGVRQVPLGGGSDLVLDLAGGLIETQLLRSHPGDPNYDPESDTAPASRLQYQLTCKGRVDIKPGCVVAFDPPPSDSDSPLSSAISGALGATGVGGALVASLTGGATKTRAYVSSVHHRLGRRSGFSTVITCVALADAADQGWDAHSPGGSRAVSSDSGSHGASADPTLDAARAIRRTAETAVDQLQSAEVGEVRVVNASGTSEPPAQTETVWSGLTPPDGSDRQARRLPIQRDHPQALAGVPYASAFAWGNCGLILPRYPGTRVVMVHRNGQSSDPIDVGALWESGKGPQNAQAGDWWLALPTEAQDPDRLDDSATPENYSGKASNDLIDAAGNRTIEVTGMTIRVGSDALGAAGERPAAPSDSEALTIEHGDGQSRIVLKKGGEIEIHAKKITLATDGVTATIDASKLDVS